MQPENTHNHGITASRTKGALRLAGMSCAIAVLWFAVLPWIAERPYMKAYQAQLDEKGIDPSAMFYTELDAMKPILEKVEASR